MRRTTRRWTLWLKKATLTTTPSVIYLLPATTPTLSAQEFANMDATERLQAASKFLLQSPPGEINDVLNGKSSFLGCEVRAA